MIAYLKGQFVVKTPSYVIIDVAGVGYEIQISLNTYSTIQHLDAGLLHTHFIVREDAHILYGFAEHAEKEVFLSLITVSGIGSSTARMMLSYMKPDELVRAIVNGDTKSLEGIKGIGKKSAERVIVELKDKLAKYVVAAPNISQSANNSLQQDALNALLALGIAKGMAEQAVKKAGAADNVEDLIKQALRNL